MRLAGNMVALVSGTTDISGVLKEEGGCRESKAETGKNKKLNTGLTLYFSL